MKTDKTLVIHILIVYFLKTCLCEEKFSWTSTPCQGLKVFQCINADEVLSGMHGMVLEEKSA